jgi:kynurenine formamidase
MELDHFISVVEDLEKAYKKFTDKGIKLEPGMKVLLATGFHERHWGTRDYWDKSIRVTHEAGKWLVSKRLSAVGFDFFQSRNLVHHVAIPAASGRACKPVSRPSATREESESLGIETSGRLCL